MDNENGVMDSDARADAALAAFSGDDGGQQQDDAAAAQQDDRQQAAADDGQQQQDGGQQQQQQQDGQLTDEQLNADPRFQELSTFRDSVVNAFAEFPGLVDDKGQVNVEEAGLQLKDASILYDIMQGKGTPSALLEVMAKNAGWSDQQKQLIANDLIGWLTKAGYLKDGQAAGGERKPAGSAKDPVLERLDRIEQSQKDKDAAAERQRVQAHQTKVFNEHFLPQVQKLCKQKQIPQEDFADYANRVAQMVAGNKAILGRIEKGNYVDIQKFFTQVYNAEAKRLERWSKNQTAAADKKNKNTPRIPAGGSSPAPAGSAKKVDVRNREDRIAAAADML